MANQAIPEELFKPKHWPAWALLGILRLITLMPYAVQIQIGKFLGLVLYTLARDRRTVTATNLRLCFPNLNEEELADLTKKTIISNGIGLIETAWHGGQTPKKWIT